jgi:hypothetical protein
MLGYYNGEDYWWLGKRRYEPRTAAYCDRCAPACIPGWREPDPADANPFQLAKHYGTGFSWAPASWCVDMTCSRCGAPLDAEETSRG